ncbi:MAG: hypothetical protein KGM42_02510 [Hyphomicrobiales bacterium]|nr:hypothetical protein [Hyphomicrobiales bacterium]
MNRIATAAVVVALVAACLALVDLSPDVLEKVGLGDFKALSTLAAVLILLTVAARLEARR